jgi:hypothetical protein
MSLFVCAALLVSFALSQKVMKMIEENNALPESMTIAVAYRLLACTILEVERMGELGQRHGQITRSQTSDEGFKD